MDFPRFRLHPALPPAIRTSRVRQASRHHFPRPLTLNHPAQPLAQRMRRQLDLIVVWRPTSLLDSLKLRRHRRRLLQQIFQLFLQTIPIRIHATCLLNHKNPPWTTNLAQLNTPNAKSPIDLSSPSWVTAKADMHPIRRCL